MSVDGERRYSWQTDHTGQESIPLCDRSPSRRTLQTPPHVGRGYSGDEGRLDQTNSAPTWTAQSQLRERPERKLTNAKRRLIQTGLAGGLKKHMLALWLILLYAFVAILSWTITCVLCYRPIGVPTYFDQYGNYSSSYYEMTNKWRKAASVGQSVVGVTSIPVTSAICAKAAAVYCQRRSDAKAPRLSLRQMLVLADKGWIDSATLFDVIRPSTSHRTRSPLLLLSAGLVAITFMISIIQTSVVGIKHISVLSAQDSLSATIVGPQVTPKGLASLDNSSVMDNIISSTITGKLGDKQPYLWLSNQDSLSITSIDTNITDFSSFNEIPKEQFIAAFPVGTDTGLIRNLALRFNISVSCTLLPQSGFPSTCPGAYPLSQTFSNVDTSASAPFGDPENPRYRARVCAPGNTLYSPWNDTADRQDISEEFWLDYQQTLPPPPGIDTDRGGNYTQHCYGNSTLGYFEMPNYWNGHVAGPLLDRIPPDGPNLTYQNGVTQGLTAGFPNGPPEVGVGGPFLTAIMAIFGPNTFFNTAAVNSNNTSKNTTIPLCKQLRYPFNSLSLYTHGKFGIEWTPGDASLDCTEPFGDTDPPLLGPLMNWLPNFGYEDKATAALTLATYAAANAILNVGPGSEGNGYFLFTSPGTEIQKPDIALAGIIVVSILLATQITGLTLLAIYASRNATWTESLDAWAMLRLGAEVGKEELPAISTLKAGRARVLDEQKGWVGDTGFQGREGEIDVRELGLGGPGRVRDGVMYRIVRGKEKVPEHS